MYSTWILETSKVMTTGYTLNWKKLARRYSCFVISCVAFMLPFLGSELFTLKTKLDSLDVNAFINSVMCLSHTCVYHTQLSHTAPHFLKNPNEPNIWVELFFDKIFNVFLYFDIWKCLNFPHRIFAVEWIRLGKSYLKERL